MNYPQFVRSMVKINRRPDNVMNDKLMLGALGLAGETGEVVEHIKKSLMHDKYLDREKVMLELGDVLWYWTLIADTLGYSLEEIAEANRAKLTERYGA